MESVQIKYTGHPADAESKLEKAVSSIMISREEQKTLPNPVLLQLKEKADSYVDAIFESMITEIVSVIYPDKGVKGS